MPSCKHPDVNHQALPPFHRAAEPDCAASPMRAALALAEKGRFATAPNPCVGAVLVKDGQVVAQGYHAKYGSPHAEVEALVHARTLGIDPAQCDLYVTLEPCNHHGKTPPCTRAILEAGIKRVVVGTRDPNAEVVGGGAQYLRDNGVDVSMDACEAACLDLIDDFRAWHEKRRAFVLLKLATTIDGRIGSASGHSQWISNEHSRALVQQLRGKVCAVLVGGSTLRMDDPRLTCRLEGAERQPLAVVLTRNLPAPDAGLTLLKDRPLETIFLTSQAAAATDQAKALMDLGCRVWALPLSGQGLHVASGLKRLYTEAKCHYVMCEGGGVLAGSLLDQGLADRLLHFAAPKMAADETARPMAAGRRMPDMSQALAMTLLDVRRLDQDVLMTYKPQGV